MRDRDRETERMRESETMKKKKRIENDPEGVRDLDEPGGHTSLVIDSCQYFVAIFFQKSEKWNKK